MCVQPKKPKAKNPLEIKNYWSGGNEGQTYKPIPLQRTLTCRENGGTLGMALLIINPIYTLHSGYLLVAGQTARVPSQVIIFNFLAVEPSCISSERLSKSLSPCHQKEAKTDRNEGVSILYNLVTCTIFLAHFCQTNSTPNLRFCGWCSFIPFG